LIAASMMAASPREHAMPFRRCLVSGLSAERSRLIRFVVAPDGEIVPDVDEKLPGRGLWVTADRAALETARRRKLFAKAARACVRVPDDLAEQVERLLARRCRELLGLALRAGQAAFGYQKVREWLIARKGALLLEASDGRPGDGAKLRALAGDLPIVTVLSAKELGAAAGRARFVHGILLPGKLSDAFAREAYRLAGFRTAPDRSRPSEPSRREVT
jgi:predicted RNA-binding protein YlxR (DUF448 family)